MKINKNTIILLLGKINLERKIQLFILFMLIIFSTFAELISIGAIIPFLSILTSDSSNLTIPLFRKNLNFFDGLAQDDRLPYITFIFVVLNLIATATKLLLLKMNAKVAYGIGMDLGSEVYLRTLSQPYITHTNRNSSVVISGIINKVNNVIGIIVMGVNIAASSFVLFGIMVMVVFFNPFVSCITFISFSIIYLFVTIIVRKGLANNGIIAAEETTLIVKILQEGLGSIRDILLDGSQKKFATVYEGSDKRLKTAQADNAFYIQAPKFIIESLGIAVIAILANYLFQQGGDAGIIIPILGVIVLSAQRMLPALQQIYSGWAIIRSDVSSLRDVMELLSQPITDNSELNSDDNLDFNSSISIENVKFSYNSSGKNVLNGINLTIPKGAIVGLIGKTGSGKSTLLDLLMCLFEPSSGQIKIDKVSLTTANYRSWQRKIAHVPQSIFILDASIAQNIAFGVHSSEIDIGLMFRAINCAQLSDVVASLSNGINTIIGERGASLSGGQIQRIGIARALYKKAELIILDEATSALDEATEERLLDSLFSFRSDLTIIMIAHRTSCLIKCDLIYKIVDGGVSQPMTYIQAISQGR